MKRVDRQRAARLTAMRIAELREQMILLELCQCDKVRDSKDCRFCNAVNAQNALCEALSCTTCLLCKDRQYCILARDVITAQSVKCCSEQNAIVDACLVCNSRKHALCVDCAAQCEDVIRFFVSMKAKRSDSTVETSRQTNS